MTKRDVLLGVTALLVGVLVTVLVFRGLQRSPPLPAPPPDATDEPSVPEDAGRDAGSDAKAPDADLHEEDASLGPSDASLPVAPSHVRDAGAPKRPTPDASRAVLREADLLIHPVGSERECVDAPTHGKTLQLYSCHGRKNQRWTFEEDPGGTSRISGGGGGCIRVGEAKSGAEGAPVEIGPCGIDAPRFRHIEGRRLQEAKSGQCITARRLETHARLVLAPCDPSNAGQAWALSP